MKMWKSRNGPIAVEDMSDDHIKNALALLKHIGYVSPRTVSFYASTPGPRGEMAQCAFEAECDYVLDAPTTDWIDIFEDELAKRAEVKKCDTF